MDQILQYKDSLLKNMDQNDDNAALSAADSEESIVNDFNQQKGSISEEALVDDTDRRVNGSKSILFDKLDWVYCISRNILNF